MGVPLFVSGKAPRQSGAGCGAMKSSRPDRAAARLKDRVYRKLEMP